MRTQHTHTHKNEMKNRARLFLFVPRMPQSWNTQTCWNCFVCKHVHQMFEVTKNSIFIRSFSVWKCCNWLYHRGSKCATRSIIIFINVSMYSVCLDSYLCNSYLCPRFFFFFSNNHFRNITLQYNAPHPLSNQNQIQPSEHSEQSFYKLNTKLNRKRKCENGNQNTHFVKPLFNGMALLQMIMLSQTNLNEREPNHTDRHLFPFYICIGSIFIITIYLF